MYGKKAFLLAVLLGMLLSGCADVSNFVQQFLQKPQVSLEEVTFRELSLLQGTVVFHIRITNPNPVGATVNRIQYNLTMNERDFVKGTLAEGIQIKASCSETVELPVTVTYLDLFQSVKDLLSAEAMSYHLFGSVGIGPMDIPYSKKGNLPVPKLPEISLKQVRVTSLSLAGATVKFTVDLKNKNPFALALQGIQYRIRLGGTAFAKGKARAVYSITERGTSTVEIPVRVNFLKLGRSAYNLLAEKSSSYEISGELNIQVPKLGQKSFPFKKTGEVPIGK